MVQTLDTLQRQLHELQQRERKLAAALTRQEREIRKARIMQRDLLGASRTNVRGASLHAWHQAAELVSGDFHQTVRLDDHRVAIMLADATGHGLSAGFLSVFAKRSICPNTWRGGSARDWTPDEALRRLNEDLLTTDLCGCEFVSAVCAVYDEQTNVLDWSRAGSPYPILIRPGHPAKPLVSDGPLAGVAHDAVFAVSKITLEPGDVVMFHSDGLDELVQDSDGSGHRHDLSRTSWFRGLGRHGVETELDSLQRRLAARSPQDWKEDDITVVALERAPVATAIREKALPTSSVPLGADPHHTEAVVASLPAM